MKYNNSKMFVILRGIAILSVTNIKKKFACEIKGTKFSTIKLGCAYI
jgi:hypothetical protein